MTSLRGIDEEYAEILAGNKYIDDHRRTVLCNAIKTRASTLQSIVDERTRKGAHTAADL